MNKSVKSVESAQRRGSGAWANARALCSGAALAGFAVWVSAAAAHAAEGKAKPAPQAMCDGLATVQAWTTGIGASIAVIGLIIIGIGFFFSHRHEDGSSAFKKLGWWGFGAVLVGASAAIAPVFISGSLSCM